MYQAFIIVLREGVEAFLMVAIVFAYLRKTSQQKLFPAVFWGILGAFLSSAALAYVLWLTEGEHQALWEGILGLVTVALIVPFAIHMWRMGPAMKSSMENELSKATATEDEKVSFWGVFLFTIFMIAREGMEMILLLFQIHEPRIVTGVLLGVAAAGGIAVLWQQFGYLVNLKRFFQITALYLLFFTLQVAVQSFHEFAEAGVLFNSEFLHAASEPYSIDGLYGKRYAIWTTAGCGAWLVLSLFSEKLFKKRKNVTAKPI